MNLPRLLSQWYRLIRGALVLACILALLVILLGRLLVPQVSTLTPQLLSLLEANTGLYWEIEALSGEWHHLKPVIRIESLTARFSRDQPAPGAHSHDTLVMREAELQIDLLASLIDLEWRISQFKANAIKLPLDYAELSGWYIAGFEPKQQKSNLQ